MTILLYAGGSPNVHKVEIMLHEVDLDFSVRVIDIYRGENFSDWFTALNPTQKVPALSDSDGPGDVPITIFDSGAILVYLAEKTGRYLPAKGPGRTMAFQWLMFQMSAVGPLLGQLTHFTFLPADLSTDEYARRRFISSTRRVYDTLEERLSKSRFLAGKEYTIADIATFAWTRLAPKRFEKVYPVLSGDWSGFPNLHRWTAEIAERPAVQRALTQADSRQYNRDAGTKKEIDRLFGRGDSERTLHL